MGDGEASNAISGTVFGNAVQSGYIGTLNLLTPAAPVGPSWQVPAEEPGFVNRTRELADMAVFLNHAADVPHARMFLLIGPPGVGKSELSRRFAARFRDRFPDGGLHVDLADYRTAGGHVDLGAVFGALLVGLGVSEAAVPASGDARRNLYRAKTHGLKALIVVDDAELAGQVRVLAPGELGAVIATTRRKLPELRGERTVALEIGPLTRAEGIALVAEQIGAARVEAEPGATAELVDLCDGLPVLLRAVCAQLVLRPQRRLADMVARLREAAERSRTFEQVGAFAVLDATSTELPEEAARLYQALALAPGIELNATALAIAADVDPAMAAAGLDDLVAANLVEETEDGRYTMHAMIRAHASRVAARFFSEDDRTERSRRVVDWYLAAGRAADERLAPVRLRLPGRAVPAPAAYAVPVFADDREALDWLQAEHGALLACQVLADEHRWDETVWLLCDPLWALYQNHKHYGSWVDAFTRAIEAAERAGLGWVCARLRCLLARAYIELARFDAAAATLEPALGLARLAGDRQLEASVLEFTGIVALEEGDPARALELFAAGRVALEGAGQTPDAARADLILRYLGGRALTADGRPAEAADVLEVAYPEAGASDPRLAGQVRFAWIEALLDLGRPHAARDLAAAAVSEAGRRAVPTEQIRALRLFARVLEGTGERELAAQCVSHAELLEQGLGGVTAAES